MLAIGIACAASSVRAQTYPEKPVRLVTAAAGAAGDFVARMLAGGLAERWGQPVLVDNRGGSAVIPIDIVLKSPPDGHTLLVYGSTLWTLPLLQTVAYSPARDFAPITLAATTPMVLVVHPSLPVDSVQGLIALARRRPGQLNYSSGIAGSATHLPAELFKAMAKVDIVRVAYKGGGPALNAILSGETQVMFATGSGSVAHFQSRRLRPLAVTTLKRSALFPDLPTLAESGLPGYEAASTTCVFAPGATPAPIVARIAQDVVQYLGRPEVRERFLRAGMEIVAGSPAELASLVRTETSVIEKLVREAGIRGE